MPLHPLAVTGDGLLQEHPVDGLGLGQLDGERFRLAIQQQISVVVVVQHLLGAFRVRQQVRSVSLADTLARLFQYGHVGGGEASLAVGRYVEQEDGVAAHGPLIDVEDVVGVSHALIDVVAVKPTRPDGRVGLRWLVVQVVRPLLREQYLPRAQVSIQVAEVARRARVFRVGGDDVPLAFAVVPALVATPAHVFPAEDGSLGSQGAYPHSMRVNVLGPKCTKAMNSFFNAAS